MSLLRLKLPTDQKEINSNRECFVFEESVIADYGK
jgi:hypothetical protein